jgi:hypothetical protein
MQDGISADGIMDRLVSTHARWVCGGMIMILSKPTINFLEAVHRRLSQVNLDSLSRCLSWQMQVNAHAR